MRSMICLRCGELLHFSRDGGWVHLDGKFYLSERGHAQAGKTRLDYPKQCRRCMNSLHVGFCYSCGRQYSMEDVDDHCVLSGRR